MPHDRIASHIAPSKPERLLCVSPYFPPLMNAEGIVTAKIVNELVHSGIDVTVLSVAYPRDIPQYWFDDSPLWSLPKSVAIPIPHHGNLTKIHAGLHAITYQVSSWARWLHTAVRRATELHEHRPFQLVYSRSYPMIAHVAGYWLKRKLRLPWVASINDPWDNDLIPNGGEKGEMIRPISRMWMRRTFKAADLVTFPSKQLLEFHSDLTKLRTTTSIVPHIGYKYMGEMAKAERVFRIVHAGRLGAASVTRRGTTLALLEGLRRFRQHHESGGDAVQLQLVGPHDSEAAGWAGELGLTEAVSFTGPVSYEESLKCIGAASVCLLVEGRLSTGIFLPSKLADYVAAGKPVVALSPKRGVVADLAGRFRGILRADLDDAESICKVFELCLAADRNGRLKELGPSADLVAYFDRNEVCRNVISLMADVVANAGS